MPSHLVHCPLSSEGSCRTALAPIRERLVLMVAGSSVAHHMLGSYQRAFLAVLLAQFTRKRFTGGMCGVVRLATSSVTVQVPDQTLGVVLHPLCFHMPLGGPASLLIKEVQQVHRIADLLSATGAVCWMLQV